MNETQRRTLVRPLRMHCIHCGKQKGTSMAEAMSKSKTIKAVTLAIIKLRLSEDISYSSQSVIQSIEDSI